MHLLVLGLTVIVAIAIRLWPTSSSCSSSHTSRQSEWWNSLLALALPPLLMLASCLAVVLMGPGPMVMHTHSSSSPCLNQFGHVLSITLLAWAGSALVRRLWQAWITTRHLKQYPLCSIRLVSLPSPDFLPDLQSRVIPHSRPFAAQVGFWNSELIVSQALLQDLPPEQVQAVLSHEQAHHDFRDTFWFFWLGWLHQIATWLPNSEQLWQRLLLLRELRADAWAATRCDRLVLAEALFQVVNAPFESGAWVAPFGEETSLERLETRIDALLDETKSFQLDSNRRWFWMAIGSAPLLVVPFCNC